VDGLLAASRFHGRHVVDHDQVPRSLISAFLDTTDPRNARVVELVTSFLILAALFQIAAGAQAVGSVMPRGLHDARAPVFFDLTKYWRIGPPFGALLAFPIHLGRHWNPDRTRNGVDDCRRSHDAAVGVYRQA
jgi:hypothetical protein